MAVSEVARPGVTNKENGLDPAVTGHKFESLLPTTRSIIAPMSRSASRLIVNAVT